MKVCIVSIGLAVTPTETRHWNPKKTWVCHFWGNPFVQENRKETSIWRESLFGDIPIYGPNTPQTLSFRVAPSHTRRLLQAFDVRIVSDLEVRSNQRLAIMLPASPRFLKVSLFSLAKRKPKVCGSFLGLVSSSFFPYTPFEGSSICEPYNSRSSAGHPCICEACATLACSKPTFDLFWHMCLKLCNIHLGVHQIWAIINVYLFGWAGKR